MFLEGRAWVLGDNVDTDIMTPGCYLFSPIEEAAQHAFEAIDPGFSKKVRPGDIIVAGKNFGCGSSRESAPQVLKFLGIGCVLAEDFARIFFRNCIAIGLLALTVEGITEKILPLDELRISPDSGEIFVRRTEETLKANPLHPMMMEFIEAGGIEGVLRNFQRQKKNEVGKKT